jgi:hypothetical protein
MHERVGSGGGCNVKRSVVLCYLDSCKSTSLGQSHRESVMQSQEHVAHLCAKEQVRRFGDASLTVSADGRHFQNCILSAGISSHTNRLQATQQQFSEYASIRSHNYH